VGLILILILITLSVLLGLESKYYSLIFITLVFSLIAILFNLELLFPALYEVEKKSIAEIETVAFSDNYEFFVVELEQQYCAYPLKDMVIPRHIIIDKINGTNILISYCALCRSGIAFKAVYNGKELSFKVVGVFRRNLIMEDNLTRSLWQQATGECIYGPLKGVTLEMLFSYQIPWVEVLKISNLKIAFSPVKSKRPIFASRIGFRLLESATNHVMTPGYTKLSKQLIYREVVFGIKIEGTSKAYPLKVVKKIKNFKDKINDKELIFQYDEVKNILLVTRTDGQKPPIIEKHWWLGWNEFNPDSEIFRG